MLNNLFLKRFKELEVAFSQITLHDEGGYRYVKNGFWQKWATSTQSLLVAVFGLNSPHVKNFNSIYNACEGSETSVMSLNAVFLSAKEDFEGGYVFNVDLRVSGEVFGDFVALARQSLSEGHKDVAAVLACAALEDALKRYAAIKELDVTDKTMTEVINALKSASLVSGAQKSLLEAMPRIRNSALHAEWAKISEPDVSSVIGFVEQFLLTKFSDS